MFDEFPTARQYLVFLEHTLHELEEVLARMCGKAGPDIDEEIDRAAAQAKPSEPQPEIDPADLEGLV